MTSARKDQMFCISIQDFENLFTLMFPYGHITSPTFNLVLHNSRHLNLTIFLGVKIRRAVIKVIDLKPQPINLKVITSSN